MPRADPQALIAFLAVVEQQSFRGAARALSVPKSTLSERVAQLEATLGVQLLSRTTRSVRLTEIGAAYYADVAPAVDSMRDAEVRIATLQTRPTGHLRITAPVELGQRILTGVLTAYAARCPEVDVTADLTDRHVDLVKEGFDLAIRVGPLASSQLRARRLGTGEHVGVYASDEYLRSAGTPTKPRDLAQHRCLVMTGARMPTSWSFVQQRKTVTIPIRPYLAVNSFAVLAGLAAAGLGIARLPSGFAVRWRYADTLRELLPTYALPGRACYAVYPGASHVSPALRAMLEVLVERFATSTWAGPPE